MNPPKPKLFSLWSKLWLALWMASGVVIPALILWNRGASFVSAPGTVLLGCVLTNAMASFGLGMSLENTKLIGVALLGGWFIMAALFLSGCSGF